MRGFKEKIFFILIKVLAFLSLSSMVLILAFILKESYGLFNEVSIWNFISGDIWEPIGKKPQVSIKPFILATLYVSIIALFFAVPLGVGFSIFMSNIIPKRMRKIIKPFVDMLAAIPSVIYGFIGLTVLVKFFEVHFSFYTGESIFCAGIVLSIMILPYIISTCDESMVKAYNKYFSYSNALGVSKWYMLTNLIIPASIKSIIAAIILALGRAMGETMAVMMVIGNSPIMPKLFGKGETIPSLIALEMGSAQVGSLHYHALFATGLIFMLLVLFINAVFHILNKKIIN